MNLFTKQKQSHRFRKEIMVTNREQGEGINWEFDIDKYILLYIKQMTNKDSRVAWGTLLNTL